ncbi:hypothetical protein GCM10009796_23110 [Microbacterium koreense]
MAGPTLEKTNIRAAIEIRIAAIARPFTEDADEASAPSERCWVAIEMFLSEHVSVREYARGGVSLAMDAGAATARVTGPKPG